MGHLHNQNKESIKSSVVFYNCLSRQLLPNRIVNGVWTLPMNLKIMSLNLAGLFNDFFLSKQFLKHFWSNIKKI